MRNTARSILTTMPAKTIISNTFDFFFIEFPLVFLIAARNLEYHMGNGVSRKSLD
jgi:hypothetical protein